MVLYSDWMVNQSARPRASPRALRPSRILLASYIPIGFFFFLHAALPDSRFFNIFFFSFCAKLTKGSAKIQRSRAIRYFAWLVHPISWHPFWAQLSRSAPTSLPVKVARVSRPNVASVRRLSMNNAPFDAAAYFRFSLHFLLLRFFGARFIYDPKCPLVN